MKYTVRGQKNCKYYGSFHHIPSSRIFFVGPACLSRTWPWVCLSPTSLSAAALLALIISDPSDPLCVCALVLYVHVSVSPSLAPLHAEKADISGGSVIERILLPASHCHGGWRERWIVQGGVYGEEEIGERAKDESIHHLFADVNEILSVWLAL